MVWSPLSQGATNNGVQLWRIRALCSGRGVWCGAALPVSVLCCVQPTSICRRPADSCVVCGVTMPLQASGVAHSDQMACGPLIWTTRFHHRWPLSLQFLGKRFALARSWTNCWLICTGPWLCRQLVNTGTIRSLYLRHLSSKLAAGSPDPGLPAEVQVTSSYLANLSKEHADAARAALASSALTAPSSAG